MWAKQVLKRKLQLILLISMQVRVAQFKIFNSKGNFFLFVIKISRNPASDFNGIHHCQGAAFVKIRDNHTTCQFY